LIKKIHYTINLAHTSTKIFKDNSSPTILVNKILSMEKLNTGWGGGKNGRTKLKNYTL